MISLINIDQDQLILLKEARLMQIKYNIVNKVGWYNGEVTKLQENDFYYEDCLEKDGKYYKDQQHFIDGEPLNTYQLFSECDDRYVEIKEGLHLVNLIPFAQHCPFPFIVLESIEEPKEDQIPIKGDTYES